MDQNILATIAASRRKAMDDLKSDPVQVQTLKDQAYTCAKTELERDGSFAFPFECALRTKGMSFICECKKASPSKGLIAAEYNPVAIARSYEEAGAAAISCLTEPKWFQGSLDDLAQVSSAVHIPVLRKDFVVDELMIYQAKVSGAAAVLLIVSILTDEELARFIALCHELGLSALVEAYEPEEVPRAIAAGARVIGVNNRDLRTFKVDFGRSIDLRPLVGPERIFVSESGVHTRDDIARLEEAGVDAVLIGETLMRAQDKHAALDELRATPNTGSLTPRQRLARERITELPNEKPRIKLCGMSRVQDVKAINEAKPDLCGFIVDFPQSHRNVNADDLASLTNALTPEIPAVGVFVDEPIERVIALVDAGVIDAVQLHGDEDADYVDELRRHSNVAIIQAFRIHSRSDIDRARNSHADLVLLDAGQGSGKVFDWSLITDIDRPFILAGGLTPQTVGQAIRSLKPTGELWGIDMSSGIETDGFKDKEKINAAVAAVRSAQ